VTVGVVQQATMPSRGSRTGQVERIRIVVRAADALTVAGIERALRRWPGIEILTPERMDDPHVAVLAGHRATVDEVNALRGRRVRLGVPIVLVTARGGDLPALAACHVVTVLPRAAAISEEMAEIVAVAAGRAGADPADLRAELQVQAEKLRHEFSDEPAGSGDRIPLTEREIAVLRLLGDGLDTADIALRLRYSERTVKNIIYAMTGRLRLRNRVHAVAVAAKAGLI
jgi:DNA-binding NarL/FixJ family response regulator